ncbi:MAG: 2-oxoglutarate dehydrogenase E1 component, partial [Planctomycetota bacterium]
MNTFSLEYIDELYVRFVNDPNSVDESWRTYFKSFLIGNDTHAERQRMAEMLSSAAGEGVPTTPPTVRNGSAGSSGVDAASLASVQDRIYQLVQEYRTRGHLIAQLDPLGMARPEAPKLEPSSFGIDANLLDEPLTPEVAASSSLVHLHATTLGEVLSKLRNTYCRGIGVQFSHIDSAPVRDWLQKRMESTENRLELSHDAQRRIYARLADATIFEEFVRRKYTGAKTFSLEGAESLIPMLDLALDKAG